MYDYSFAEMVIAVHAFQIFSTIFNFAGDILMYLGKVQGGNFTDQAGT